MMSAGKRGKADEEAFKLTLIEALKDKAVSQALSAAILTHMDAIADMVSLRIDARLKSLTETIKERDNRITALESTVHDLQVKLDDQEQYSRRESLRVDGIAERENESTDQLILELCNQQLNVEPPLQLQDIARSHRTGDRANIGKRAILVKFNSYRIRNQVIRARRQLKTVNDSRRTDGQAPIYMNEDLTRRRAHLAYQARSLKKTKRISDTWTWDGLIRVKDLHNRVHTIQKESDLSMFAGASE